MIKRLLVILQAIFLSIVVNAQQPNFTAIEADLSMGLRAIVAETSYSRRDSLNAVFVKQFETALRTRDAFNYPFDSLKNIGRLNSDDGMVRLYTWNIPQVGGTQHYYGFIQVVDEDKVVKTFCLNDNRKSDVDYFNTQLGVDSWHGALYYQIVTVKEKSQRYYVLMGYDYNNLFTSRKIIEALSFSQTSQPIFGLKVFDIDGKQRFSRIIFEFAARVTMTLRFESRSKTIVFDHLSPAAPQYVGNMQHYGPDFSYDGFTLKDGIWSYVRDLDMRNNDRPKPSLKGKNTEDPFFLYRPNYKK